MEFTEKYLLILGGLVQSPIGSEGRVIDAGKTDECLTQNNITIKEVIWCQKTCQSS